VQQDEYFPSTQISDQLLKRVEKKIRGCAVLIEGGVDDVGILKKRGEGFVRRL
jgi:hypothetical protein